MSIKTWEKEFFDPIKDVEGDLAAVEHSIKKWTGLRPENLKKHELVTSNYGDILDTYERFQFSVNSSSCALCEIHYDLEHIRNADVDVDDLSGCENCPLRVTLGRRCDSGESMPYVIWGDTQDPEPMIAALEKARGRILSE